MFRIDWTPEMQTEFWKLFGAGVCLDPGIANKLGVSATALRDWMRREGLPDGRMGLKRARAAAARENAWRKP